MVEIFRPNLSMKKKRFVISMNPAEFLGQVLSFKKSIFGKRYRIEIHSFVVFIVAYG